MRDLSTTEALTMLVQRLLTHSTLGAKEVQAVLSLPAAAVHVKAHQEVVRPGEPLDHACVVASGLVARFCQFADGRRQVIGLYVPGDIIETHSLLLPRAPYPVQALCPTVMIRIPNDALRAALRDWPALAEAFWRDTLVYAGISNQIVVSLGRRDARGRVAHLLCEMAVRYGAAGHSNQAIYCFPATQELLGDALGLTSVHVNRTLKSLREEGLVRISSHQVRIQNWAGLQAVAEFDPAYLLMAGADEKMPRPERQFA